jgi:2-dehydropantoate 2-reductase
VKKEVEMKTDNTRILVIGAGVNGSAVATHLYNAGLDVKVLARGKRYEEIRAEGIIIENPFSYKRSIARVPVINSLNPEDLYDFVLVVVRKNQVADLLPVLAQNKSPNIVFMGNNLSGPAEFAEIIDQRRIMLGTVVAGGKRDGSIIRAIVLTSLASIPFGEADGTITPRLMRLIQTLRGAGIKAKASTEMIDHQMTHAIGVALIGKLTMKYNCDIKSLARSREDMILFMDARREAHQVLRALGHKIVPRSEDSIRITPRFLQIAGMRWLLNSKLGEVGLAYHVSQAPDEVQQLVNELRTLVDQAGLPVPAIRQILGADERNAPVP